MNLVIHEKHDEDQGESRGTERQERSESQSHPTEGRAGRPPREKNDESHDEQQERERQAHRAPPFESAPSPSGAAAVFVHIRILRSSSVTTSSAIPKSSARENGLVGKELAQSRQEKGRSLEAVARPAKISAAYLHKLERGVVDNPPPRVLARIAAVLEVPYLRFMALAGYLDEVELAKARLRASSPRPHPLADQQLTPAEWRAVGAYIKELLAQRTVEGGEPDSPS